MRSSITKQRGRRRRSHQHPREKFFAVFALPLAAFAVKSFYRKERKRTDRVRPQKIALAAAAWVCPKAEAVGN